MSVKLTAGRCRPCQGRRKIMVIYQWKASDGRRLYNASCPKCGTQLDQTCVGNMKHFQIMESEPTFVPASWQEEGYDEGMAQGGDAYNDMMFGESPDY